MKTWSVWDDYAVAAMQRIFFLMFLHCCFSMPVNAQAPAIEWQLCVGGTANDSATCIRQCSDGGYIITGYTRSADGNFSINRGGTDLFVAKLNNSGIISWQRTYGGTGDDKAYCVQECRNGGFIVAGYTASNDGDISLNKGSNDYWVIKLNDTGGISWQKTYGGSGWDQAAWIVQTIDGGYIVAGFSNSADGDVSGLHQNQTEPDYWIVKLNDTGAISWQKCYGSNGGDIPYCIQQTKDSGYIISGYTDSDDGDVTGLHGIIDCWVLKINDTGTISWEKCYGGEWAEYAYSIQQTKDGGYIFAGSTESGLGEVTGLHGYPPGTTSDCWIVKLDDTGKINWEQCYGGKYNDMAYGIEQTPDGGYIFAGAAGSNDGDVTGQHLLMGQPTGDVWVVKLNDTGQVSWEQCYGGTKLDIALSIQQTADSGYIVAGFSNSTDGDVSGNHGSYDCWVVKLNATTGVASPMLSKGDVRVWPNPVGDVLHVKATENVYINVLSVEGKMLMRDCFVPANDVKGLGLSDLFNGVYFLQIVYADGSRELRKIVKE